MSLNRLYCLIPVLALTLSACLGSDDEAKKPKPGLENATYVENTDRAEQNRIAQEIWQVLIAQKCWSIKGSSNNYSFSNPANYRYVGITDTVAGQISLQSAGKYGDRNAARVTLRDEDQLVVVISATEIAIAFTFNGSIVVNSYFATDSCL
jgi:hypothetical protein